MHSGDMKTRGAGAVLLAYLGILAALVVAHPEESQPLPGRLADIAVRPLQGLAAEATVATLGLMGTDAELSGSTVRVTVSGNETLFAPAARLGVALRSVPLMGLMLLIGVAVAWRTWPIGWVRKLVLLTVTLSMPFIAAGLVGVANGVALGSFDPRVLDRLGVELFGGLGLFAGVAFAVMLWYCIKALVAPEEPSLESAVPADGLTDRPTGLAWVLLGLMASLTVVFFWAQFGAGPTRWTLPFWMLLPAPAGVVFVVLHLLGQRWAGRFMWIPFLLSTGPAGAAAFMLAVLIANDERTAAMGADRIDPELAQRLRRRSSRMLMVPSIALVAIGLLGTAQRFMLIPTSSLLLQLASRYWFLTLPVGILGGAWAAVLARMGGSKQTLAWAVPTTVAGLALIVAHLLVPATLSGPLAKRGTPHPAGLQVENHRLTNFPESFGPYRCIDDEPVVLPDTILDTLAMTGDSLSWYYIGTFQDASPSRQEGHGPVRLSIMYQTGPDTLPHVPEDAILGARIASHKSGTMVMDATVNTLPEQWRRLAFQRTAYERLDGSTEYIYHVFCVNAAPVPDRHEARVRYLTGDGQYAYWASIQMQVTGQGSVEEHDLQVRRFLQSALPAILDVLPDKAQLDALDQASR